MRKYGAASVPVPARLYSDGGIHAAQAWFLLRAKGFREAGVPDPTRYVNP